MNWKQAAIDDLKNYARMEASVVNTQERIAVLRDRYTAIRPVQTDCEPVQGGGDRATDAMVSNIVERDRLSLTASTTQRLLRLIDRGLATLDARERRVLDLMYIHPQHGALDRLMEEFGVEKAQIYRIRNTALYKYVTSMYGIPQL